MKNDAVLDAVEEVMIRKGGSYLSMADFAAQARVEEVELRKTFPNEALICAAWLERKDEASDKIHNAILMEDKPAKVKVDEYFSALISYMEENQYRGCPYSNVAACLCDSEREKRLQNIIAKHKESLKQFFMALSVDINPDNADLLGETLVLLYSGATTESRNLASLPPVQTARKAANAVCELFG